jgi:putative ubiquitin-RnfH superfamily antitoxin RatB of RatAB toxin-antitoxin module
VRIHVAFVAPEVQLLVAVDVPDGATVADAIRSADVAKRIGDVCTDGGLAIFGQRVDGATPLRDGDRVEITRPLVCDPKAARRARSTAAAARPKADRTGGRAPRRSGT